ncbi:MAG TPA: flagellar basal body rod protein FlgC [candidate division Zixibacteria bacterium]|nr:flagellar basal body rod protein FlgC [candidate division Zixibacteria bacterium]
MNLFGVMQISASGLGAERVRAEVVAGNMANAESTRTPDGGPYRRKQVVFQTAAPNFELALAGTSGSATQGLNGVRVREVVSDATPPVMRYEPGHPDADAQGFVAYPAINPVVEMTDLMGAMRSYQMNAAAISASKQMIQQSIDLLK